jgi:hypothetical protein
MKKLIGVSLAFCIVISASAQLPDAVTKAKTGATTAANPGKLLTQFAGALKTTALLSSFTGQKTGWLAKAGKVSDAVGMAQSVASLAGGINPAMFKSGFNVNSIVQAASTVKTLSAAGGLLKNLSGGLKPEAFTNGWTAQQPAWESALSLLK